MMRTHQSELPTYMPLMSKFYLYCSLTSSASWFRDSFPNMKRWRYNWQPSEGSLISDISSQSWYDNLLANRIISDVVICIRRLIFVGDQEDRKLWTWHVVEKAESQKHTPLESHAYFPYRRFASLTFPNTWCSIAAGLGLGANLKGASKQAATIIFTNRQNVAKQNTTTSILN